MPKRTAILVGASVSIAVVLVVVALVLINPFSGVTSPQGQSGSHGSQGQGSFFGLLCSKQVSIRMAEGWIILRFLAYGITGFALEYLAGQAAYKLRGKYLYLYPGSRLKTSSPLMLPAWGTVGLIFEGVRTVVGG